MVLLRIHINISHVSASLKDWFGLREEDSEDERKIGRGLVPVECEKKWVLWGSQIHIVMGAFIE